MMAYKRVWHESKVVVPNPAGFSHFQGKLCVRGSPQSCNGFVQVALLIERDWEKGGGEDDRRQWAMGLGPPLAKMAWVPWLQSC